MEVYSNFLKDWLTFLEQNINSAHELPLMGDLNVQVNIANNPDTITLLETLNSFGLQNQINFSTHPLQNTLDLIIIQNTSFLISQTSPGSILSDISIMHYNCRHYTESSI